MSNISKQIRNLIIWLTPFVALIMLLVLFKKVATLGDLEIYLRLLNIVIWPVTLLVCAYFFRKVVTYLFFSMEEFNFFGAKGKLKNVQEMIEEKAEEIRMREREREEFKNEILMLEDDNQSKKELIDRAIKLAEKLHENNERLVEEKNETRSRHRAERQNMEQMINDLLAQIANLQEQLTKKKPDNSDE